ncbi:olfactory receptor 1361-like [Rhinatrema bivittatum]|uniref:olfactory receptor 1361-like n=1 Tax=Rhinatrema bivittatum TaxID=194408 RepID=UPI00112A328F|nr:olfactory receptor 1361-like [Rhinatrema bivittatum]
MERRNSTVVTEFLLLGLSNVPEHQMVLFGVFLTMYIFNVLGNSIIITIIRVEPQLHTPMYFFLSNLSFVDICLTSITVPKMLANIILGSKSISLVSCFVQIFLFHSVGNMDSFLLAVMAYDRYIAICDPLHYATVVNKRRCIQLVAISWLVVSLHAVLFAVMTSTLSYCGPNTIHHFFCDLPPLMKLSCSDISTNELIVFIEGSLIVMGPCLFILFSYAAILMALLKMHSVEGRYKAFSTCASHLTVVVMFYGTVIFMYFRPLSSYSFDYDRVVSVMYSAVTPMLNPFIYSLRNKEVKGALYRAIRR